MSTTTTVAAAWRPDQTYAAQELVPDALVLSTSTVLGRIDGDEPVIRVGWIDDAPASFVAEGAPIPESEPDLSEVLVTTGKVAQLVRFSRELMNQPDAGPKGMDSVRRAVIKAANVAYLSQPAPDSAGPPAGLLNVDGITDAGEVGDDLDGLADALTAIEQADGQATHIIAAPDAWGSLRKMKSATGSNTALLGAGTDDAERRLFNLPVITTPAMPAGTILVVDRAAVVSAVGDVRVAASEHAYFATDSVGLRCTFRFGQNVVKPERVAKLVIAT